MVIGRELIVISRVGSRGVEIDGLNFKGKRIFVRGRKGSVLEKVIMYGM